MDLQGFIGEITSESADDDTVTVYRGHPNSTYRLKPTIFRTTAQADNEHLLLRDLVAMHPDQFAADGSALEMLVRMQHYSLPTRLLDATWNPLVALYFACLSKKRRVLKRGTNVAIAIGITGAEYRAWCTRAQNDASPGSVTVGMGGHDRGPVVKVQRRGALRVDRARLIEDLLVPLRRQFPMGG